MDEKRLYDILGQNVEVPDMVNKKLEQAYGLMSQTKRPAKPSLFRVSWAAVELPGTRRRTMTRWAV